MTTTTQQDRALDLAAEMEIKASQARQMGFTETAKWLKRNADLARKWAATEAVKIDEKSGGGK